MSKAISYSRYSTHKKCGLKYKFAYIDKIEVDRGEPGPALVRGNRLHDNAEEYMLGKIAQLDPELEFYAQWLHGLRENYTCHPELKWGITEDWEHCGFDHPNAWLRGIFDLLIDPPEEGEQLEIME